MTDWIPIITGIAVVVLIVVIIVLRRQGWKFSEITFWPPTAKMTPPPTNLPSAGSDTFLAENESEFGKVDLQGAADTASFTARGKSKFGDVSVKRNSKK